MSRRTLWVAATSVLVGIVVLGEAVNATRLLAAALIVSGLVLMKLSSGPA